MGAGHIRIGAIALTIVAAAPVQAQSLAEQVTTVLRAQGPGTRFGLLVTDTDGREIVAISPDDRFVPGSNTKLFTTAAAFATFDFDSADTIGGAAVRLDANGMGVPDVVLVGAGDARLSSARDCAVDCLAALADAVAKNARVVGDVVGDDTLFPDERWSPGMSWNNIPTRSGTAISALTLDDNELPLKIAPAAVAGAAPSIEGLGYYSIENRAVTVVAGRTSLDFERLPAGRVVRVTGTIPAGAPPETLRLAIDDPADYAAWRLRAMLAERGVRVTGRVVARHRPLGPDDDPKLRGGAPAARPPRPSPLARLIPPPLAEDLRLTNKVSQNVHAELFLRRVSQAGGSGSIADGQAVVQAMLASAGVPRWSYDLSDGSGMSSYNRVTPRATVGLLRWTAAQPWGSAFRATLPIGGVDGTLRRRFVGTPLAGKVFAKTGTLNQANAIAGFLVAASGRTLVFASYAGDMPGDASATKAVDAALNLIAATN